MDDDGDEPREPSLNLRPPDYFPDSFWQPPPQLHLEPDLGSGYFVEEEDDNGTMLGKFRMNLPADNDHDYQFGELDPIGEGCSSSSSILSFPSTSVPVAAASNPDAEKSEDKCSPEIVKGQKRMRQPRFAFMTKSEIDNLEDGYRWRKYGQKAVKNSPFPRSYYRCTNSRCTVKKRVERSSEDPTVVITTYEGQHCHHSAGYPRGRILVNHYTSTTAATFSVTNTRPVSHPMAVSPSSQFHVSPPAHSTNAQSQIQQPPAAANDGPSHNAAADGGLLGDIIVPQGTHST